MFSDKLANTIIEILRTANIFMERNDEIIQISPQGRPYPTTGEWFLALSSIDILPDTSVEFSRYNYGFELVLSRRSRPNPQEKLGSVYTDMLAIVDKVVLALDRKSSVLTNWATMIGDTEYDLNISGQNRFQGVDPVPMERDYTWWMADGDHTGTSPDKRRIAGYSLGINFRGVRLDLLGICQ